MPRHEASWTPIMSIWVGVAQCVVMVALSTEMLDLWRAVPQHEPPQTSFDKR